ncbi:helix-turn-helix domain-containing protein [Streptomyces sp. SHP 1-2]|uniref:helix-turn-helix domain-containing protein n=1 Tax=Streptomyces sp. SHP 1-2 TaxID=2769489 RepID=UPI002237B774|nr:helix-turn-helix transcriptional regulator [Streptomyces sp. SHP 1-2]MCW5252247.1 helix-turn-helix transcriptional regulator [Streptomyces sp. SHP 1-2]
MPLRTNGAEIRRRRELAGMTGVEFAKTTGYDANYVSQIELGNLNGGPRFQRAAAKVLDCTIADITAGSVPRGSVVKTTRQKKAAA